MVGMFRVSFPMQSTSGPMVEFPLLSLGLVGLHAHGGLCPRGAHGHRGGRHGGAGLPAQSPSLPLTRVKIPCGLRIGLGGWAGDIELAQRWASSGLMPWNVLEWSGFCPSVDRLHKDTVSFRPLRAGAPFSARPGAVLADSDVDPWLPLVLADLDDAIREIEAALEVELQRALLWGSSAQRGGESEALGASTEVWRPDRMWTSMPCVLPGWRSWRHGFCGEGPTWSLCDNGWWRGWMPRDEVDAKAGDRVRRAWQNMPAPDPSDAAAILRFVEGADRYASVVELADSLAESYAIGLGTADLGELGGCKCGLVGRTIPTRLRLGARIDWGATPLGSGDLERHSPFEPGRQSGHCSLIASENIRCTGTRFDPARRRMHPSQSLPKTLRAMNVSETEVDLEELVGSGPCYLALVGCQCTFYDRAVAGAGAHDGRPSVEQWPRGLNVGCGRCRNNWPAFLRIGSKGDRALWRGVQGSLCLDPHWWRPALDPVVRVVRPTRGSPSWPGIGACGGGFAASWAGAQPLARQAAMSRAMLPKASGSSGPPLPGPPIGPR